MVGHFRKKKKSYLFSCRELDEEIYAALSFSLQLKPPEGAPGFGANLT